MRVIAFNGSPRKQGNTASLIEKLFESLREAGVETELYQLGGKAVHGCIACMQCWEKKDGHCVIKDDVINECIDRMAAADGVVLGSPTYFANVSTEIKALIDRGGMTALANGGMLRGKVGVGVVAVRRGGAHQVYTAINALFGMSEMIIPGSIYWNMGRGLAEQEVLDDEEGMQTMTNLGKNMAWVMQALANTPRPA